MIITISLHFYLAEVFIRMMIVRTFVKQKNIAYVSLYDQSRIS